MSALGREAPVERVLCAAIWIDDGQVHEGYLPQNLATGMVFAGWRHHNCFMGVNAVYGRPGAPTNADGTPVSDEQRAGRLQGFLTTTGRYVDRKEAGIIAFAAGQTSTLHESLHSEDLD